MGKKHRTLQNTKNGKSSEQSLSIMPEKLKKLSEDFAKGSVSVFYKVDVLEALTKAENESINRGIKIPDASIAKCSNPDKDDGKKKCDKNKESLSEKDRDSFFENAIADPEITDEKLVILTFFQLNSLRKLTREEVSEFFNTYFKIKTFKVIKRKLKSLGIEKVLEFVIDLRHRYTPEGEIFYPEKALLDRIVVETENVSNAIQNTVNTNSVKDSLEKSQDDTEAGVKGVSEPKAEVPEPKAEVSEPEAEVPISDKKNAEKKSSEEQWITEPVSLKKLFLNKKNVRYYFFADDIFDFRLKSFIDLIEKITSQGIQPVFCLFEEDLLKLDAKKEECYAAQHFLKLFAMDDSGEYTCLFHGNRPTEDSFINHCLNNKITVVTGDAVTILNCKMNSVNVFIPECCKDRTSNVCKGDKILGFDSCVAINLNNSEIDELLKEAKTILLSDIQLKEIHSNLYLLRLCAYYGEIKKAEKVSENMDKNIVHFYKENPVDMVYTLDAGFKVFARFANVPCTFLAEHLKQHATFDLYDIVRSHRYSEPDIDVAKVQKVFYDALINYVDGKLRMDSTTRDFVFVYRNEFKKTDSLKYIELFVGDKIFILRKNNVLLTEVIDIKQGIGKILFWGTEFEMLKQYPQYSIGYKNLKIKTNLKKITH